MRNILVGNINKLLCEVCSKKANFKINYLYSSINFSWDKPEPWASPNCFFCSEGHKKEYIKEIKEAQDKSKSYLAELDESMNYCEFFIRENGNEWIYKKDWFEFKVNWLWDYKSQLCKWYNEFKEAYIKYFWDFNRFKLHNRYSKW